MICRAIPYEGKDPYLFVSYCHADQAFVGPILEQLAMSGYRAWYDAGNKPGVNWLSSIEEHLENASAVLAFISRNSSNSYNCNKEIIYAIKCGKRVIPVRMDDAPPVYPLTYLSDGGLMHLVCKHYT